MSWDFINFTEKTMNRFLLLITVFIFTIQGLVAQNPATPDTLVKKNITITSDTVIKVEPVAPKQQEQPKQARVRKDTRPLKDRIDFDLNTSFWTNTRQVSGEISLLISYRFPKILSIGAGPTYIYNYQRDVDKNLNGWGGKVFAKAQLLKFFYVWTEYQGISNQYISDWDPVTIDHEYVDSWFVGAGLNIRLGRSSGINVSVLYDLLHGSSSPYNSATTYRLGFSF
jgi:hypothetical protein